jgi:hypothetical protein
MAAQNNLMIEAGTDYESNVFIGVGDDSYSFTNKVYRATLRSTYGSVPQYSFTITEDSANKKITLKMSGQITTQLTAGAWVWDLIESVNVNHAPNGNAFTTTSGSAIVEINWTAHGLTAEDEVVITSSTSLPGGFANGALNGTKSITIVDSNNLTFNAGSTANATATGGAAVFNSIYKTTRLLEGDVLVTPFVTARGQGEAST